jgi:dienelactone hydrolase
MGAYILNVVKEHSLQVQIENLAYEDERLTRAQAGVSHVIDELQKDQSVSGSFGIIGSSQGAIFTAYVAGIDSRLKSSVMVVGGGNMPGILAYGQEKQLNELRNGRMAFLQIKTQKEYEKFLQKNLTKDPLNVAASIAPHSSYLFIANRDNTVPTRYQQQLKNSIPHPMVWNMTGGHGGGVVKATVLHKQKITRFFLNRLF